MMRYCISGGRSMKGNVRCSGIHAGLAATALRSLSPNLKFVAKLCIEAKWRCLNLKTLSNTVKHRSPAHFGRGRHDQSPQAKAHRHRRRPIQPQGKREFLSRAWIFKLPFRALLTSSSKDRDSPSAPRKVQGHQRVRAAMETRSERTLSMVKPRSWFGCLGQR